MYRYLLPLFLALDLLHAIEPISPLPKKVDDINMPKALLGKQLFFEKRLSKDETVSCNSCHNLKMGGADKRKVSLGIEKRKGNIQSPTVLNARYNFKQFWNGRAEDLKEQAEGPLHNPVEMHMDKKTIEARLNASAEYRSAFKNVYKKNLIHFNDVIDAIVEFEKALVTPNSRFDRFLRGEIELSEEERKGYLLFKTFGCITCHNGINIGGNSFQKIGLLNMYPHKSGIPDRYSVTKNEYHKNTFKVPTLRNIEHTAPFFHDASADTLQEAIEDMGFYNLGISFSKDEAKSLIAFLRSLSGETPAILKEP